MRELKNVVELAIDLADGATIDQEAIERVLRIQRGEPLKPKFLQASGEHAASRAQAVPAESLVSVQRQAFQKILERSKENSDTRGKKETPFYILQQELATRAIIEGLRAAGWKLRPAAKLLGISPMKLRGTLKESLSTTLKENGGDLQSTASALDIPLEILQKKADDFGLEGISP